VRLEEEDENVEVPYFTISRLEISRGKVRMTWIGALGGAVLGGTLGAISTPFPAPGPSDDFRPPSGGDPLGRMVVGAMIGGFLGGLAGSAVEMERWDPVFTAGPRRRR
jgi:outer membrane lipoprotein SlyB